MKNLLEYIEENKDRFVAELSDFLRISSVSSDDTYIENIREAAQFIKEKILLAGADMASVELTEKHPIVYAEKIIDPEFPTVLIYGHYDVQPADPIELWNHPPFEPIVKDGKIYARGACDDKGQMYMHIKSLEYLSLSNSLQCNLKFLFEGEEEIGSPSLEKYLNENKDKLKADVVLVSDTAMIDNETPSLIYGLKGITYFDIEVTGSNKDLHSGIYGGSVANPLNILCSMIGKLKDEDEKITIPHFYDDIVLPSDTEIRAVHKAPFDINKFKKEVGVDFVSGEKGFDTLERIAFRPTLDVNGMWGGHTGQGAKTVIPSKAFAKISMRLVNGQSVDKVIASFESYFKSLAPETVEVKISVIASCESALTPIDSIAFKAAESAIEQSFGKLPIPLRIGGSIPVISMFQRQLNIQSVLMGFGLDSDDIHSPNEHFGIWNFLKGIETIPRFYECYSGLTTESTSPTHRVLHRVSQSI